MYNDKIRWVHLKIVMYYTGWVIVGISFLFLIPVMVSAFCKEWSVVWDFVTSFGICEATGFSMIWFGHETKEIKSMVQWKHGYVIAAFSWLVLTILCAVPYQLSGHMNSFLDACFDVMSGFTTTGVFLLQDLDHLSNGLNLWRHILTFVGGQGMVVLALSVLVKEIRGAYKIYVGEAKDIELVPNVKGTAQLIWKISLAYLLVGTFALWIAGIVIGMDPWRALFHGFCVFASSWSTGGFAPNYQNMMFYHSFLYEMITVVIMIAGSLNFGLHYAIWKGKRKEVMKNIEVQSFFITATVSCVMVAVALSRQFPDAIALFRRVIYNVLSAHTTTGFGNVYARQFIKDWGDFGVTIMVIVMLIGGSACSTAGGIKGLRVGILAKGLIADVKRMLAPDKKVMVFKYHHMKEYTLDEGVLKASLTICVCYLITFGVGVMIGTACGFSLADSAFEAASVTGNVGLSGGMTTTDLPVILKIYDIAAMYLGRLEFLSVFALIGTIIGGVKNKCKRKN